MFIGIQASFFAIILCLIVGIEGLLAMELDQGQDNENLLPNETFRQVKLEDDIKLKKTTSEMLSDRIDILAAAFEKYETLTKDEQLNLRTYWKKEVNQLDIDITEFKLRLRFIAQHAMISNLPNEEYTITKETEAKLIQIKQLYPELSKKNRRVV